MKRPKIEVSTVKNGYTLDVDGKGYMYFNVGDMLAGILAHVGMGIKDPMEEKEILEVLFDALIGSEYAQKIANMRDNILNLEGEYSEKLEKVKKTTNRLREYEDMADELTDRISSIRSDIRRTEDEYKANKKMALELIGAVEKAHKTIAEVKEELKTSRALLREMNPPKKPMKEGKKVKRLKDMTSQERRDHDAAVYERKKAVRAGDITVYPDAGVIIHHTKK
jgi:chromosome segregation ATPase